MPDVVPMVSYEDCAAAARWLVHAFGFVEEDRFEEDGEVTHVTLRAGDGTIFLGKPGATYVNPKRLRAESELVARMYEVPWALDGVWVRVDDLDAHFKRASAAGATILSEPEAGPVGKQYRVEDPEGHRWMFAETP